jgi:DNA-binding response OmpR family regulator
MDTARRQGGPERGSVADAHAPRHDDKGEVSRSPVSDQRILIVDDDAEFAGLTKTRLQRAGFAVDFHQGGFGLVNAMRKQRYALVLLDVNMPALGGDRLLPLIRQTKHLADVKVLLLSSLDAQELRRLSIESQANGWISKSASRDELIKKIRDTLG